MAKIGYTGLGHYGVAQVLHTAFLIERRASVDSIRTETLQRIADAGPVLLRRAAGSLSRTLVAIFISRRDYQHAKADDLGPVHNPLRRLRPQVLIPITWR